MKMRMAAVWMVLVLCVTLVSCTPNPSENASDAAPPSSADTDVSDGSSGPKEYAPLLYKVTDADGDVVWLFGSIHVGTEDMYPLPEYVMNAYGSADMLAVEADITAEQDAELAAQLLLKFVYTDGTTIKDHISTELYDSAVEILKDNGMYSAYFNYYSPAFWCSLIQSIATDAAKLNAEFGVDRHLLETAHGEGKPVDEIESAEFQYDMMASFSPQLQEYLLESAVEGFNNPLALFANHALLNTWKSGNEERYALLLSSESEVPAEEQELYEEYNTAMIVERNDSMADYAEDALEAGEEVFICVGAAHVVGEGAMADLLAERGYTVERVNE